VVGLCPEDLGDVDNGLAEGHVAPALEVAARVREPRAERPTVELTPIGTPAQGDVVSELLRLARLVERVCQDLRGQAEDIHNKKSTWTPDERAHYALVIENHAGLLQRAAASLPVK